jgi:hypothetical protein
MVDVSGHVVAVGGCPNRALHQTNHLDEKGKDPLWWMLVDVFLLIRTRKKKEQHIHHWLDALRIRTGLGTHPPTATNPPRGASRTAAPADGSPWRPVGIR